MIYRLFEETFADPALGRYRAFGIRLCRGDREILRVSDVFLDRASAEDLVARCNALALDPRHLFDVIEDALL